MIKVISFNVDGSLLEKKEFDTQFWYEMIPLEYSRVSRLSLAKSKEVVQNAYGAVSLFDPEWHKPETWFKRLQLKVDEEAFVRSLQERLGKIAFRDAKPCLERFYGFHRYKLVAFSDSSKSLLKFKFKTFGVQGVFSKVMAAVDDRGAVRKDTKMFKEALSFAQAKPEEMAHIGDDPEFDLDFPASKKIHAFLLDRSREKSGPHVVHDLTEFLQKVKELDAVGRSSSPRG